MQCPAAAWVVPRPSLAVHGYVPRSMSGGFRLNGRLWTEDGAALGSLAGEQQQLSPQQKRQIQKRTARCNLAADAGHRRCCSGTCRRIVPCCVVRLRLPWAALEIDKSLVRLCCTPTRLLATVLACVAADSLIAHERGAPIRLFLTALCSYSLLLVNGCLH